MDLISEIENPTTDGLAEILDGKFFAIKFQIKSNFNENVQRCDFVPLQSDKDLVWELLFHIGPQPSGDFYHLLAVENDLLQVLRNSPGTSVLEIVFDTVYGLRTLALGANTEVQVCFHGLDASYSGWMDPKEALKIIEQAAVEHSLEQFLKR